MKEKRSASQVLFGFLPEQTVDLKGGIWKVREWRNPKVLSEVDDHVLRRELKRLVYAWSVSDRDRNFYRNLEQGHALTVLALDEQNGVQVDPFPKIWICKACNRLHVKPDAKCACGSAGGKGHFPFVAYHDECGAIREPQIPYCPEHDDVKIVFPGSASSKDIQFSCPTCLRVLRKGFGNMACSCGKPGRFTFNVHRAAAVYSPRSLVIVNPPSREKRERVANAGGAPRALSWVLSGMQGKTFDDAPATNESIRRQLEQQGLPQAMIDKMLQAADISESSMQEVTLPAGIVEEAEAQAVTIALATIESRTTIADLTSTSDPLTALGIKYRDHYPLALDTAKLEAIELIDRFPILTGHFGYTRGSNVPGESALRAFERRGTRRNYDIYAELAETEAFFVRLDPKSVANWLVRRGFSLDPYTDSRSARAAILRTIDPLPVGGQYQPESVGESILTLIHSYSHRFIRIAAVHAGIERSALSELLVPLHLGFFVYAASRGDFVLGGLQAVFESELDKLLLAIVGDEHRCPMDPGCSSTGGACVACLHLGEPSCRFFNRNLSRKVLHGALGYFS